jgi:methionyl-tRNA synthetase
MYVWFDALTNYINTLGWHRSAEASGEGDLGELFEKYWTNGTPTQYCGKDNTRFQSAMWQAMLMAADFPNSHQIGVNGFITGGGGVKMSKTLGNVVDPRDIVTEYGTDALRYFLLREVSSFEDSPFTIERFKDSYNSGLANGLGNLVSRVLTMVENYSVDFEEEKNIFFKNGSSSLESFKISDYMNDIWEKIQEINQDIQIRQPFKKIKENPEEAIEDVRHFVVSLLVIAESLEPVLPETSQKIKKLISERRKPETPLFLRKD